MNSPLKHLFLVIGLLMLFGAFLIAGAIDFSGFDVMALAASIAAFANLFVGFMLIGAWLCLMFIKNIVK